MSLRTLFGILLTVVMATPAITQTAADRLYKSALQLDNAYKLDVQKPIISAGIQALKDEAEDEDLAEEFGKIAKYIKRMRILILDDDGMKYLPSGGGAFLNELKEDRFEEYLTIRSEQSRVNIMVREKKDKIRNLLFLVVDDEEGLLMIDVKARIPKIVFESLDLER